MSSAAIQRATMTIVTLILTVLTMEFPHAQWLPSLLGMAAVFGIHVVPALGQGKQP